VVEECMKSDLQCLKICKVCKDVWNTISQLIVIEDPKSSQICSQ
jgi:hypothetical protein